MHFYLIRTPRPRAGTFDFRWKSLRQIKTVEKPSDITRRRRFLSAGRPMYFRAATLVHRLSGCLAYRWGIVGRFGGAMPIGWVALSPVHKVYVARTKHEAHLRPETTNKSIEFSCFVYSHLIAILYIVSCDSCLDGRTINWLSKDESGSKTQKIISLIRP